MLFIKSKVGLVKFTGGTIMLSKLSEEDFSVLRGSFESGRQSPNSFGGILILSVFLQGLMFFLVYVVAADRSIYPYKEIMFSIHLGITIILVLLSVIYAIPSVYMKHQRMQYFLSIVVSQNLFGLFSYIMPLFFLGKVRDITKDSLLTFTVITLLFGLLFFIATLIRFFVLLRKGEYRTGSKRDELRSKVEKKSYFPIAVVGGTGLVFVIQYLIRTVNFDIETTFMVILGIVLFYAMLFVLPEQLVILYCKHRFESFNYDQKGNLKPLGTRKGA